MSDPRESLKTKVQATGAAELLPHHRRDALFFVKLGTDFLDVAVQIAEDNAAQVAELIESGQLYRPTLAKLSELCVQAEAKLQFVIIQPFVLAQEIARPEQGRGN